MASPISLPAIPATLKPIAHLLKTASEHETRDPVVTYWARLAALQNALKLDKKSKEAQAVLLPLMDWLEKEKKILADNEAVTSEIVATAHIENYAMKLFEWADKEDRASRFGKNVVKAFYTASNLFDVMQVLGELTPEVAHARKYSKWKAAYIHNCLKRGEQPVPGPIGGEDDDIGLDDEASEANQHPVTPGGWAAPTPEAIPTPVLPNPTPQVQPPSSTAPSAGLQPQDVSRVQKLCKFASSALDYDDADTAIKNLTEALEILKSNQK